MITTFVPFKRHRSRKKHLSNKALTKIRNKQRLWKLYRTTGNNDDYHYDDLTQHVIQDGGTYVGMRISLPVIFKKYVSP